MRKNPGAEAEIYAKIHIYRDNRELNEMETQREREQRRNPSHGSTLLLLMKSLSSQKNEIEIFPLRRLNQRVLLYFIFFSYVERDAEMG